MRTHQVASVHRLLRVKLRLRQSDVSLRAGVNRKKVGRLERGEVAKLTVDELERCFAVFGATIRLSVARNGAELDRLLDEGHASLVGVVVRLLESMGWRVQVEVSFSDYGDRGSIDILAWHAPTRTLLVVEIKSELGGLDRLLRPLDVKVRLASKVARSRFGWDPRHVARLVVLPENRTARRQVDRHGAVLDAALPDRARALRRWLREPVGALSGLWFLSDVPDTPLTRNPSAIRRVRRASGADAQRDPGGRPRGL